MKNVMALCCISAALSIAACSEGGAPAEPDPAADMMTGDSSDAAASDESSNASSSDVAGAQPAPDILTQCRSRAASEYSVAMSEIASLEPQSDRVDGTFPVNGSLADGSRFQCNFSASSELTDFVKVDQPAPALSSSGLEDFEGARAGQAEMGIQRLGYEIARNEGLTNYWLNASTGECYAITTSNGRYAKVEARPRTDCE